MPKINIYKIKYGKFENIVYFCLKFMWTYAICCGII